MMKRKKRATQDEPIFLDGHLYLELENLVNSLNWKYKTNQEAYLKRDKGLYAFLFLTGCRVSEALQLKRKQFRIYPNRIEVANIVTLKRGKTRIKITLPKIGSLKKLTYLFESWLVTVPEDGEAYVFPRGINHKHHMGRKRAYEIIARSGKFPHWARAVCETIYGRKVFKNDAYKLKQFMGLQRLDSTSPYVQGSWEENEKDIYKL